MAFALSVIKGDHNPEDCPHLDKEVASMISQSIVRKDWKGDLIKNLRKEVADIPFDAIARGLGAQLADNKLNIKCLGMDFQIDPEGKISTSGHINPWIEILLLHYVRTGGNAELSGKWVSFGELKGGLVKAQSFKRECEEPLKAFFDDQEDYFADLLVLLGGISKHDQPADKAWVIYPLPKVPFLILYWVPDKDHDSSLTVLLDMTADIFLDVESLIFLGEGLVEMFRRIIAKHG
jgi:hypothetical protein